MHFCAPFVLQSTAGVLLFGTTDNVNTGSPIHLFAKLGFIAGENVLSCITTTRLRVSHDAFSKAEQRRHYAPQSVAQGGVSTKLFAILCLCLRLTRFIKQYVHQQRLTMQLN